MEIPVPVDPARIRSAWEGRVSGCQLGKAVELLSMLQGTEALRDHLAEVNVLPLRDYVPWAPDRLLFEESCRGRIDRSRPDDDINYSVLALTMLEAHGHELQTVDIARGWLRYLPVSATFTAERAAYLTLCTRGHEFFAHGAEPGFDLADCADNEYDDFIGAQIRADVYGWVYPGAPGLAADLAERDAALSHRGDGVAAARFVAALGALVPCTDSLPAAVGGALEHVSDHPATVAAVEFGASLVAEPDPVPRLHERFPDLGPVHALNNLALVVWGLLRHEHDFSAAIGDTVASGWDTDCNGATVGALWGLTGRSVPDDWTAPWDGRVEVGLAGIGELALGDLVDRTVAVADRLRLEAERR